MTAASEARRLKAQPSRTALAAATAVVAATALAACSGSAGAAAGSSTGTSPATTPTASAGTHAPASAAGATDVTITTTLTSEATQLATVGPGTPKVYGWNLLKGTGMLQGAPVSVTLQGSVSYTGGAGPFEGFVTIAATDGSTLALRLDGNAAPASDGSATALDGRLDYIGGTGSYENLVAGGMFHASRKSAVGAPVETSLELTVEAAGVAAASSSTAAQ